MDSIASPEVVRQLQGGAWFGRLSPDLQRQIVEKSTVQTFDRDQVISREGDRSKGLVVLIEGRVRVMRHADVADEVVVHVAEPGFWFGEIGLLGDLPNAVTVVAAQPSKTLMLPARRFEEIVDREPRFYREFTRLALERYAVVIGFVAEANAMDAETRLRRRLVSLVDLRRLDDRSQGDGLLNVSQAELANMVGVSRQRLNRMLKDMESQGFVALSARRIRVLDPEGLRTSV